MKRLLLSVVPACCLLLTAGSFARAQDEIRYYDRAKKAEATVTGSITDESPSRVAYKPGTVAGTKEVPAADVIEVTYQVRAAYRPDYRGAVTKEKTLDKAADRKKALAELIKEYQTLIPKLGDAKSPEAKFARRHMEYKVAQLTGRLAEEDRGEVDAAIEALTRFKKQHADGWQITHAVRQLARLQIDKGDFDAARQAYEELAKLPGISREARQEAELLVAQALAKGKKFAEAEKMLQAALANLPKDDPQRDRASVYLAECQAATGKFDSAVKELRAILDRSNDPTLKAVAHNALGDTFLANNQPRDAMWEYLWVDVIYYQDKQEHARAVSQLVKVFEQLKDDAHAKQYRELLLKLK
jgi:predicted negative regulator of RcsB-dependent stress response